MESTVPSNDLHFIVTPGGIVDAIIAAYGMAFMRKVALALGGKEIKIPGNVETLKEGHRLVQALGHEDAIRLSELFSGEFVSIPKGYRLRNLPPHGEYLLQAIEAGKSVAEMADDLGLTMRSVRRAAQKMGVRIGTRPKSNSSGGQARPSGLSSPILHPSRETRASDL
ncbi:MAG: hypothetical protein ACOH2J_20805 [Allorhizobium sp.]